MKNLFFAFMMFAIVAGGTSCATIFTKSTYPVTFTSNPSGADLTIVNIDGRTIHKGSTPATVTLRSAAGYMKREEYQITFVYPGQPPQTVLISSTLEGWYFGNLLLGGLIGMLIIDPASGAMYKLDATDIHVEFGDLGRNTLEREFRILEIDQVPEGVKLEKID